MKYLFVVLTLFLALGAYGQCSEFDNLLKKGDNYLKGNKPNYQEAINAYTAAILACSNRAEEAKQRITKMVNDINRLKESAVAAEKKATVAQQNAETALDNLEKALEDIRRRNLSTFESFAQLSADLIYSLDYDEALEKMKVAVDIEVDVTVKRQRLKGPLCELLFFFAEGGRRPELARTAAEWLLQLEPESEMSPVLQQCLQEGWTTRQQYGPLLTQLLNFQELQARYYPEMVSVPLGEEGIFEMGSDTVDWGHQPNESLHRVKLSPYQIAATPVTFYQFALFCEAADLGMASRTPYWGRFGDHSAVNINWYEAVEYANWLNEQQGVAPAYKIQKVKDSDQNNQVSLDFLKWKVDWDRTTKGFRLPTEAEWELAARGGVDAPKTLFAGSDTLGEVGWFWENSGDKPLSGEWDLNRIFENNGRTHPVKQKRDNGIGIYDFSGNVWEWCWDWYDAGYYEKCRQKGIAENPDGPMSSVEGRVVRGACWYDLAELCRVASRASRAPVYRFSRYGFRLVFVP